MDYDIVYALTVADLCRLVNEKIAEGWTPLGGVGIGGKLYQAITRSYISRAEKPLFGQYLVEAVPATNLS